MRKISELGTNESLDVIVAITPLVEKLATCKGFIDEFKAFAELGEEERTAPGAGAKLYARLVPIWFDECRAETLGIIKTVDGMTDEELEEKGAFWVLRETDALFTDEDFINFFKSFVVIAPTE